MAISQQKTGILPAPFALNVFDSAASAITKIEGGHAHTHRIPLHPASYRTGNRIIVATLESPAYLESELNVQRLNDIHEWLKVVGLPMKPRPLHVQRIKLRDIVVAEQMDLHLVWSPKRIFVKPVPRFLLDPQFWNHQLCGREDLYKCALGFLLSYTALIEHESDYQIAKDARLLPEEVTWSQWVCLVEQLLNEENRGNTNIRFKYGELRLGRLNMIYRFRKGQIRGYLSNSTTYGDFVRENFSSLIAFFAFITIILSAMQVGLGTHNLQNSTAFHWASYVFAIFSMIAPLFSLAVVLVILIALFFNNLIATMIYHRRKSLSSRKSRVEA